MTEHDDRCEASWNDGVCACEARAENAREGRFAEHETPCSLIRRIFRLHN